MSPVKWIANKFIAWLVHEDKGQELPPCDFDRLSFEIRPCDVVLVEGRSRVSQVIKNITLSPWTHSALYIGRLHDIADPALHRCIQQSYQGDPNEQLLVEALLGEGTVVTPLNKYADDHLRLCRPQGLTRPDAQRITEIAVNHIGTDYDMRQLLDLARFMFPYGIVPRRWRSSLFEHHAGSQTRTVCSSMIAELFSSVHFPVLPVVHRMEDGEMRLYKRNTRLYTPKDFDYSPYFEIIKYPLLGFDELSIYRQLPWDQDGKVCNTRGECYAPSGPSKAETAPQQHKDEELGISNQGDAASGLADTSVTSKVGLGSGASGWGGA